MANLPNHFFALYIKHKITYKLFYWVKQDMGPLLKKKWKWWL